MKSSIWSVFSLLALICMTVPAGCGGGGNGGGQLTATHFSVSAPASATVGSTISVTVTALDASNMTATTYAGKVHFTSTDTHAVLPSDSSLTSGMGTFSVTFMTAGSQTITATDTVTASIVGTSSSISAASQTTHFSVTAPASAGIGASFNVTVTALDSSNHTVTTYAGTFQFTSTDPSAVLPGPSMVTSGIGTFAVTLNTAGTQTVTATDTATASITGTSNSITVSGAATATHLAVNAPAKATAISGFDFTVTALDASNNVVTAFADPIKFTSTDAQADLPAVSMLTNGTATFPAALRTVGNQTITATDTVTGSITGTSGSIAVAAASGANPVPLINQPLSPDAVAPGGPSLTLTVNGTGFVAGSVVRWNGSARTTTFLSESTLTANITAADVASFNTAAVTVFSPAPGGGTSNVVFFETTRPTSSVAFTTPTPISVAQSPNSVATGDFNADGKLDLAVANGASNNVSILLGKGDGTFQTAVNYNAGSGPQSVAVGDFNADGKLDVAIANNGGNVSILLGKGDGTFDSAVNFDVGSDPNSVVLGDFNADGKLDLAVANTMSGTVSVLLGNGDGTFQPALNFAVGINPVSLAVGDFNGDGKLDLAVANFGTNGSVLLGNGDGTFQPAISFAGGGTSVVASDFNADGKLDLALSSLSSGNTGPGTVNILLGKGDGTFQAPVSYNAGSNTNAAALALGDFNGDGKLDLAVGSGSTNSNGNISLLLGNGDGTFQSAANYGEGSNPYLTVGDFNADGRLDLAVVDPSGSTIDILLQPPVVTGPNAFLAPDSLTFDTQLVNTTSAAQQVLLSNYGTAALTITNLDATANFAQTNNCGSSLSAGASCAIEITFTPTMAGSLAGTLNVTDNAPGSPQSVALVGSATSVELTPNVLRFECRQVINVGCACKNSASAKLTNVAATPLNISNITTTGPFTETNSCPATLAAGSSCNISVQWSKTSGKGVLSVFDDATGSPQTVSLVGFKLCNPPPADTGRTAPDSAACQAKIDIIHPSASEELK
jgi:hypothetical protein